MPFYEYKCDNCGYQFEELQTMSEEQLLKCPQCGKDTLKKLIGTGSGIIFKGSGFYLTDYKNKKHSLKETPAKDNPDTKSKTETTKKGTKKETKPGKKD
jgi:putative FmdB family regulatory protein